MHTVGIFPSRTVPGELTNKQVFISYANGFNMN